MKLILRDGPALRALAMIPYAHFLLDRRWPADINYVRHHLYCPSALRQAGSTIKNDLEEVAGGWWQETFDLWEEVFVKYPDGY
jgi:glucoamylase